MFCKQCGKINDQNSKFCVDCGTQLAQATEQAPQQKPTSLYQSSNYAGFWIRTFAGIIDYVFFSVFTLIIVPFLNPLIIYPIIFLLPKTITDSELQNLGQGIGFIVVLLIMWLWFAIPESSKWQATIGKKILGLKVTDEYGERIELSKATKRFWSKIMSALILCIGFIMVGFTKKNQGLHDKIAGTLVIKDKSN